MNVRSRRDARKWTKRLAWLLGIWLAGVALMGIAAMALKAVLKTVGLTT